VALDADLHHGMDRAIELARRPRASGGQMHDACTGLPRGIKYEDRRLRVVCHNIANPVTDES
jgi:hypothetical protein